MKKAKKCENKFIFQDMCIRVPILKFPENGLGGSDSGKKSTVRKLKTTMR